MASANTPSRTSSRSGPAHAARPFLKWVGGKGRLLPQYESLLPKHFAAYFEPFVGGGAMFFALRPQQAVLSDINAELIDCYLTVRDSVEDLIAELQSHRYDRSHYYDVRATDPHRLALPKRAARTIYLNRSGFNGLYRVNRAGQFNVPFGRYSNPRICDADNLRSCSALLSTTRLVSDHFSGVLALASRGDFVYFDPPYVPRSATASFTQYSPGRFGQLDQEKLCEVFVALANRRVKVMLSNSDTPLVRKLYKGFHIDTVQAARSVNCDAASRGHISELVVRSYS